MLLHLEEHDAWVADFLLASELVHFWESCPKDWEKMGKKLDFWENPKLGKLHKKTGKNFFSFWILGQFWMLMILQNMITFGAVLLGSHGNVEWI